MVGTTSNGLLTYVNSETASVESSMTFDGSLFSIFGNQSLYGNLDVTGNPVFGSEDTRPAYYFGGSGLFQIKGQTGAWQSLYGFRGSLNTDLGGFGASGTTNTLSYYYIGDAYNDATMVIKPNAGNVGIGTYEPLHPLEIKGDSAIVSISSTTSNGTPMLFIGDQSDGGASSYGVGFKWDGTSTLDIMQFEDNDDNLSTGEKIGHFKTTSGVTGEFYWDGKVGIGTTSPDTILDIEDTEDETSIRVTNNNYNNYLIQKRRSDNSQILGIKEFGSNGGLSLVTAGTERLNINNLGNVGIGTTTPAGKLQVTDVNPDVYITSADTGQSDLYFGGATTPTKGNIRYSDNADAFIFNVNTSTEAMRIISSGNVGIGTTTPAGLLHVSAGTSGDAVLIIQADTDNNDENDVPQIWFKADGDITEGLIGLNDNFMDFVSNVSNSGFRFFSGVTSNTGTSDPYNGATEKMRITGPGKVGIGLTAPTFQLQLSTNSAAKPSSNVWTITSDSRVKENIRDYTTGLEAILEIEPKLYDYNGKAGFEKTKNNIGIIAQDIQEVMPETIISYNAKLNEDDTEDTELLSFDGHAVTFALINAVKELKAEIEQLKTQINN